ncbi:copper amine oxidase N-terminal domain-containing protein, partial [Bhargavaea massiliensis]
MLLNKIIGYAVIALLSLSFMTTDAQASSVRPVHIPIITNGKALQTDVPPIMVQNRILVPFRAIAQSTGANVHWDATTRRVIVQKNKKTIILQVQSRATTINGQSVTLDVPPIIYKGHTFVPVRFVSEALDANVQWTGKEVRISWNALQRSTFSVYVNQTKIESHAMTDGVYTYIPLKQLLTAIDVNIDWIETNETMTVRLSHGQMMITAGKREVIVDNHEMITPLAPIRVNDEWYVSASWVMSIFGAQMATSGTNMFF